MTPAKARIELIVGLGNPGNKYVDTRHNAGFWFLDALAGKYSARFSLQSRFNAELAKFSFAGRDVRLLKPQTFMNLSGDAVGAAARYFKVPSESILVVYDEIDLPPGTVRLKNNGGHGGHNGMRDIIAKLSSKDFWRLRIGVGHPGSKDQVVNYVLHRAGADEQKLINESLDQSLAESDLFLNGELERAMHTLHTKS